MAEGSGNSRFWQLVDRLSSLATFAASVAIVVALASLLWLDRESLAEAVVGGPPDVVQEDPASTRVVSLGRIVKGQPSARLAIIEFSDFECPFCARYATGTHARLEREYVDAGKVKYGFRNMPLDMIHPNAGPAAEAAECAGRQGRFWQMYDTLFANQRALGQPDLLRHGRAVGLDPRRFASCLEGQVSGLIDEDRAEAKRLSITSTPTFLLGEIQQGDKVRVLRTIKGAHTFDVFRDALDAIEQGLIATR